MSNQTKERKDDHIKICLEKDVQAKRITTGFEDIFFVHRALPEIDREKIDLSTKLFDHKFCAPIIVGAMTGGTSEATKINKTIAEAVQELDLGMGVGSQRAAIEDARLECSFAETRRKAPTAFLIANIGAPQLVQGWRLDQAQIAVNMIDADALAIHLNPLQEAIQPEGETNYANALAKIKEIATNLNVPVIAKETGAGIAAEEAKKLEEAGVKGIDVSGAGGTSWAAVEYYRAKAAMDAKGERLGQTFWDWGIPTAVSVFEVSNSVNIPVIASGGLRTGLDVAKSLALGASLVSVSAPVLWPATRSVGQVKKTLELIIEELKNAMFLTGCDNIKKLKKTPVVVTGKTTQWLLMRGFHPATLARQGSKDRSKR
ncbi:MAG TPA: type 2 isopentenyl-diphosphate Delta-isomerase [Candidatus Krumholzibacteriaceae bacterium]|nr:type 2 isopentenyl-diphosphate Delta-isomerase [Candidatus Krumholzibacteriaceae bacterium]